MASLVYNRGKRLLIGRGVGRTSLPSKFKAALVKATYTPNADHATWADVSANEIGTGNGYSAGGIDVESSSTGFTADAQDDTGDTGDVTLKDLVYTASGGTIPAAGAGARYLVLMDFNATQANGQLIAVYDLAADKSSDVSITASGFKLRGT
jgi:hypothetical protein